jgi:hypothetical protein
MVKKHLVKLDEPFEEEEREAIVVETPTGLEIVPGYVLHKPTGSYRFNREELLKKAGKQ